MGVTNAPCHDPAFWHAMCLSLLHGADLMARATVTMIGEGCVCGNERKKLQNVYCLFQASVVIHAGPLQGS
jgi:hypothetical protein